MINYRIKELKSSRSAESPPQGDYKDMEMLMLMKQSDEVDTDTL